MSKRTKKSTFRPTRRGFLKGVAAATGAIAAPTIWIPNKAYAQTAGRGQVKHILYIRLSGGFRFTTAFNGDVADEFNPFGLAGGIPAGTEWGPSSLLGDTSFIDGDENQARVDLGMQRVVDFANSIATVPCVDHEPLSGGADGNHGSGLERFYTCYPNSNDAILSMFNYGLKDVVANALANGEILLPALSVGDAGIARGTGELAAYRPPVLNGNGFEDFGFNAEDSLPPWAADMTNEMDPRHRDRVHPDIAPTIDSYIQSREATTRFSAIFNDDSLKIADGGTELINGISNDELNTMFDGVRVGRSVATLLRLFAFGCPIGYLNQGGYDYHSDEESRLPGSIAELSQLISATRAALLRMTHPSGGSLWDHTLVVFGSEFGRTTRGGRFNSARGSDHSSDLATRWMSMPMMGGLIDRAGVAGRTFGRTRRSDLVAEGQVYSYRSFVKTMMDWLACDHSTFFTNDPPINDFVG